MYYHLPKDDYSKIQAGMFGLIRYSKNKFEIFKPNSLEWYHCRESFHYQWNKQKKLNKKLFFCASLKQVQNFLTKIEKELGIWFKTQIYRNNIEHICCIIPARFWRRHLIRMSLFTILLRAAQDYSGDWKKTLFEQVYAQETEQAINYFLSGFTVYNNVGNYDGWCQAFNPIYSKHRFDQLLRRPKIASFWKWLKRD